ncbi:MAG: restriction endonuclease [Planctomycetes bacterium]|nr:restriction endonuclease [Planctomycetota bacterium]NOG55719.1 restriction endonuclease [Planctomycetota bacterium]
MRKFDTDLRDAVKHFWITRQAQSAKQGHGTGKDKGSRSAVTGGKQMDGFVRVVRALLREHQVPESSISTAKALELPGWFRAEKKWDLIIVHEGELLATIEFKSQIGPSFGNNFNNRTEEALGSATDMWAAYREGAFKPSSRPFLGYLMLLEDCVRSQAPVKVAEPHFPVFSEFKGASYKRRYELLIEKLLRDRLYDGACLIMSNSVDGAKGDYYEPQSEFTFAKFIAPLLAHVVSRI